LLWIIICNCFTSDIFCCFSYYYDTLYRFTHYM
jgi:hypothetical protein